MVRAGAGGGMDTPIHGMDMATLFFPQQPVGTPAVRVEVRNGSARPAVYDVTGEEFLIGSVPGCDLRLPGTNLPPVVCLIARQADGVRLRRLAPTLPVLVNGQPIGQTAATSLTHGDCISIGAVDIHLLIESAASAVSLPQQRWESNTPPVPKTDDLARREKSLVERERQLEEQTRELESDRILWYRRRDEIDQELQQARQTASRFDRSTDDLSARDTRLAIREEELNRRQAELQGQQVELLKLREETLGNGRELSDRLSGKRDELSKVQESVRESFENIHKREESLEAEFATRRQLFEAELQQRREEADKDLRMWHDRGASGLTHLREQIEVEVTGRLKGRAEELDRFQLSLREAAVQLRERKTELDDELRQYEPRRQELLEREETLARRLEESEQRWAELQQERAAVGVELRAGTEPLVQKEKDLLLQESEIERLRKRLEADSAVVEKGTAQYQADLVRLDRWQVMLDEKEKHLQTRAMEIDHRFEQFLRDARDLEEQVLKIDAREEQLRAEEQRQGRQRTELDERDAKLNERLAQIEGQQTMVAALRTRLEHMREEQRAEASRIADERGRLDDQTRESQERLLDAERLRDQLSGERMGASDSERIFKERSEILQVAVARMRDLQKQLSDEDERLRKAGEELDATSADLAERDGLLKARTEQLIEQQRRLDADRQALKQREESIFLTEGTRESLQDQLRRRAEELMTRGRELDDQARQIAEQREALEHQRSDATGKQVEIGQQSVELARRDEELRQQNEKLQQAERAIAEHRQQFEQAQARWGQQQIDADEKAAAARQEIVDLKQALAKQASELFSQVPDMEARAQTALERTAQARESLRGQLTELHSYTKQSQEDLEKVRTQVQTEIERMRQQETGLNRARTEHRHAVASFRQQLIEWQSRFSEMKQTLSHGEFRIERREKVIDATSQQLVKQAEQLEVKQREVAERRGVMEQHLVDMREWYRKKLRELVESRGQGSGVRGQDDDPAIIKLPEPSGSTSNGQQTADDGQGVILSLQNDLDPADRKLGELMRSLELVDGETLVALWAEARRQHRPLRQVLLASKEFSVYQMALIETGNLNGLVLGRFRVQDRLTSTPREAVYRVFDPQSAEIGNAEKGICLLRQLGESEMHDAVRPDEYRQRFSAARDLAHPNIAATREVLDINGRPAVVQEWLHGLPGGEFPAAAGVPGVWFRLLSQAALGLHTAHQAGLIHGRLNEASMLLTRGGSLKVLGFGEPPWLHPGTNPEATAEDDLRALGRIVHEWSQLSPRKKGKKGLPEGLLGVLRGLGAETSDGIPLALYPSMAALLEDLDQVSREVSADSPAWDKLLEHVEENATEGPLLRQSA